MKAAFLCVLGVACFAQNYTARKTTVQGIDVIRLADSARGVEVSILPTIGNRVSEMKVHGENILYFPATDLAQYAQKPELSGVPFLAPWANRLSEEAFWASGEKYTFNMTLGNVRGPVPIHGLLFNSNYWEVTEVDANRKSAHVTARLRFWKHPELMAQWPFASVLSCVAPRPGSSSFTTAPETGLPWSSVTLPSSRPFPFQSWA